MEKHKLVTSDSIHPGEIHREAQKWITSLHLSMDELNFIDKLLHSYVFEPNTPNLFERLQDYIGRLEWTKEKMNEVEKLIIGYEIELVGLLECDESLEGRDINKKYAQMKSNIEAIQDKFQMLKTEIFNYAGGILKKRDK